MLMNNIGIVYGNKGQLDRELEYYLVYSSKEIFYVFSDLRIIFIGGYSPSFALHLTQPL
jgi:hypothetical protein